jgi:hypothetical protein
MYPTYDILAAFVLVFFLNLLQYLHDIVLYRAGIIPSNKTTYSLSQLQGALKAQTGATPYLGCEQNGTALSEVWYFHHVRGSVSLLFPCHCRHRTDDVPRPGAIR